MIRFGDSSRMCLQFTLKTSTAHADRPLFMNVVYIALAVYGLAR
jgi:hypothetical protein